ncbi:hypothetical protein B0G77_5854 [Paraburkholderia sp. BL10I2N1]|nr:hypothetical protein B0G77_5854 [Paraburkholderia sp. BL10I2N1]
MELKELKHVRHWIHRVMLVRSRRLCTYTRDQLLKACR